MSIETLAALLRRLRREKTVTVVYPSGESMIAKSGPVSQNELARRSGVDAAEIHRVEVGARLAPRRETLLALASALELDDADTARLLIAAGYWPFATLDGTAHERIIAAALAIAAGADRPADATDRRTAL